mgnify:CR=1 FL=1
MEFIEENKDSEKLQQVGIENIGAVKLSTVHQAAKLYIKCTVEQNNR